MNVKVLLVDDHWLIREGIRIILKDYPATLSFEEAGNSQAAIRFVERMKFDVILMDYHMLPTNGVFTCRKILEHRPSAKILFVSMYSDKEHVYQAIEAGALGFVCKDAPLEEFLEAFRTVLSGGTWFKGHIAENIVHQVVEKRDGKLSLRSKSEISGRELDVIKSVCLGQSSKVISENLKISPRTVDVHKGRIYKKLGINNASELVRWAMKNNIMEE
jgi:DNA-binding NarL/FixJ family response regulator